MTPDEYENLILRARERSLAVDVRVARDIERALNGYVDRLTDIVRRRGGPQSRAVREARAAAQQATRELRSVLEDSMERGIRLSAARIAEIQDRATRRFVEEAAAQRMSEQAASQFVSQFVGGGNLRGASAYLARIRNDDVAVASRFKTILNRRTRQVATEVDHIITRAVVEGADPATLGRRLRGYVTGSENFDTHLIVEREAGEVVGRKIDLRTVPGEARDAARNLRYKANRIAVTEMSTARHEATVAGMKEAPMVQAVKWNLSANRGSVATPDECDLLADANYHGLGPGIYPVGRVPAKPHPFDRCYTTPAMRPLEQWDQPKPEGDLDTSAGGGVLTDGTDARRRRAEENARQAVQMVA